VVNLSSSKSDWSLVTEKAYILGLILELARTAFAAAGGEEFPPRKFGKAAEPHE
jgi:hypothetical protein